MNTQQTLEQILYGEGTYASALPVLILSAAMDALDNLVEQLVRRFNRRK